MANKAGGTAATVERLIRPTIEGLGLRLWDVRFEKEGADWYLRVFIDRDEVMDTDMCEAASRAIDPILDEADPIEQAYFLEVGSPGLGRRLTRPEHFAAVVGQKVAAHLYRKDENGEKEAAGTLLRHDADGIVLQTEAGERAVAFKDAGLFKLCDDENLFG